MSNIANNDMPGFVAEKPEHLSLPLTSARWSEQPSDAGQTELPDTEICYL